VLSGCIEVRTCKGLYSPIDIFFFGLLTRESVTKVRLALSESIPKVRCFFVSLLLWSQWSSDVVLVIIKCELLKITYALLQSIAGL